jgi:uncharacterized membrane protein YgdD (TMEM256/DUF423 family)
VPRVTPRATAFCAAILGFLSVAAGAFGAHLLRAVLAPESLAVFETAARYQLFHAIALMGVAWAQVQWPGAAARAAAVFFVAGVLCFSGSLYLIAGGLGGGIGLLTPIGGLLLLAGWAALALAAWRGACPPAGRA